MVPIWFLAIIFPFFGPINSAVGALLVSFTVYILPSLAHMLTYRKASARQVKKYFNPCIDFVIRPFVGGILVIRENWQGVPKII